MTEPAGVDLLRRGSIHVLATALVSHPRDRGSGLPSLRRATGMTPVPVTLTPGQVVGQVAASRMRTSAAAWGKPKPTRQVARTATRSLVKNTDRSALTSASRRTAVTTRSAGSPHTVPTGASGEVSSGTPKIIRRCRWSGSCALAPRVSPGTDGVIPRATDPSGALLARGAGPAVGRRPTRPD